MLLPRFSLRMTLLLLTSAAFFFVVVAQAVRGSLWAIGPAVAIGSVLSALVTYAIFFVLCTLFGRVVGIEQVVARSSRGAVVREPGGEVAAVSDAGAGNARTTRGTEAS